MPHDLVIRGGTVATAEKTQRADVGIDAGAAQILEKVVVQVDAVQAGLAGIDLLKISEIVVDEMRKGFRWIHALFGNRLCGNRLCTGGREAPIPPMVQ